MSDSNDEKQRGDLLQGELSGSRKGLYAGTIASEIAAKQENQRSEEKENKKALTELILNQAEQAYSNFNALIDQKLSEISKAMEENRHKWDERVERLDKIDDLLEHVKNGGTLNFEAANKIIENAGKTISKNATSAEYYHLLVTIKTDDLKHIDCLDKSFNELEKGEKYYKGLRQEANNIYKDRSLSEEQKAEAYKVLNNKVGSKNFIGAALEIENPGQKSDMEDVSNNDLNTNIENLSSKASSFTFGNLN